ncbi:hypothetical protein J4418_00510 [Candidatus Woesearchaeota archaeon]|nr:hypothetical protein [Candidatus Woesearchaeota archaeon]
MIKILIIILILLVLVAGCSETLTGYTTASQENINLLIQDCANACAKCNPVALTAPCNTKCSDYYDFGGIEKVEKYTLLFDNKCN